MGGWAKPRVPNTISGKKMAGIQSRQQKHGRPMFDPKAVKQRKASGAQRKKSMWS